MGMKKIGRLPGLVAFVLLVSYGLAGAAQKEGAGNTKNAKIFEIREKMFIEQCNDIYLNPDDYLDRMIKLEGIYEEEQEESGTFRYVIRYGPGCCGNDGVAGFEVLAGGMSPLPRQGDWVEAIGSVQRLKDPDGLEYIVLKLSQLKVKEERGAEYVGN